MKENSGLLPRALSPPVHVHVDETTPVHVHIKKRQTRISAQGSSSDCEIPKQSGIQVRYSGVDSGGRRTIARPRPRSVSPPHDGRSRYHVGCVPGPWVPPPGKSTHRNRALSEGPFRRGGGGINRLDADNDCERGRRSDEDDELERCRVRKYEQKITSLISEVAQLRSELDEINRGSSGDDDNKSPVSHNRSRTEELLRTLRLVETDGQRILSQMNALRELASDMADNCDRVSTAQTKALFNRQQCLRDKLCGYEVNSRRLRHLLRDQMKAEGSRRSVLEDVDPETRGSIDPGRDKAASHLSQQRTSVAGPGLQRMILTADAKIATSRPLGQKTTLASGQVENNSTPIQPESGQGSKYPTRLEGQSGVADAQGQPAASDIQSQRMSAGLVLEKVLSLGTQTPRRSLVQLGEADEFTPVTSGEERRVSYTAVIPRSSGAVCKGEEGVGEFRGNEEMKCMMDHIRNLERQLAAERLEDKDRSVLIKDKEDLKRAARIHKENAARCQDALNAANIQLSAREATLCERQAQIISLQNHVEELIRQKRCVEQDVDEFKRRVTELECVIERMAKGANLDKADVCGQLRQQTESMRCLQEENSKLQADLCVAENKLDHAESELTRMRSKARDYEALVEDYRTQVKLRLESRLEELEPMPELLRSTELRLKHVTEELEHTRHKHSAELQLVKQQLENAEIDAKKACGNEKGQSDDLCRANLQIEALTRENVNLLREHEAMIERYRNHDRDKSSDASRASQSQLLDMECQLNQCRIELTRIRREKDENDRKLKGQLHDITERLEQSHKTNRSLQTYVQFLKNSYLTVFGDAPNPDFSGCDPR